MIAQKSYVTLHMAQDKNIVKRVKAGYKLNNAWACVKDDRGWSLTHISSGLGLGHAATVKELKTIVAVIDMDVIESVLAHRDERGVVRNDQESQANLRGMFAQLREYGLYH